MARCLAGYALAPNGVAAVANVAVATHCSTIMDRLLARIPASAIGVFATATAATVANGTPSPIRD